MLQAYEIAYPRKIALIKNCLKLYNLKSSSKSKNIHKLKNASDSFDLSMCVVTPEMRSRIGQLMNGNAAIQLSDLRPLCASAAYIRSREWMELVKLFPSNYKNWNLEGVGLGMVEESNFNLKSTDRPKELRKMFSMFPKKLESLNLNKNDFDFCKENLGLAFRALPKKLKKLSLDRSGLKNLSHTKLILTLKGIPFGLKSLSLADDNSKNVTPEELINIIKALPKGLEELDLSSFIANKASLEDLKNIFDALPKNLRKIKFADNWLSALNLKTEQINVVEDKIKLNKNLNNSILFKDVISSLPKNLTHLNLPNGWLRERNLEELKEIIKAFPLKEFNLSRCELDKFNPFELKEIIFESLKLEALFLEGNSLNEDHLLSIVSILKESPCLISSDLLSLVDQMVNDTYELGGKEKITDLKFVLGYLGKQGTEVAEELKGERKGELQEEATKLSDKMISNKKRKEAFKIGSCFSRFFNLEIKRNDTISATSESMAHDSLISNVQKDDKTSKSPNPLF